MQERDWSFAFGSCFVNVFLIKENDFRKRHCRIDCIRHMHTFFLYSFPEERLLGKTLHIPQVRYEYTTAISENQPKNCILNCTILLKIKKRIRKRSLGKMEDIDSGGIAKTGEIK